MNPRVQSLVLSRLMGIVRQFQPGFRDLAVVAGKVLMRRAAGRIADKWGRK